MLNARIYVKNYVFYHPLIKVTGAIMHSSESPYASVGDENDDVDGRTIAARARLTPYQFEKLKFLVCSIFGKTQVEASESVGSIYDLLLGYHGGKEENATDTMCLMLEQVSRKFHHSKKSSFNSDILSNKDYQWRAKLIKCADEVKKQRKVLNYIHETFDLDSSTEDFSSPILLFEHMIQSHRLTVGKRTDLERVEKATTLFRKSISDSGHHVVLITHAIFLPQQALMLNSKTRKYQSFSSHDPKLKVHTHAPQRS